MIALNFSRTELQLLIKAIEAEGPIGWSTGDDKLRVNVLKQKLEKAIADLRAQGWHGGR